MKNFIYKMVIVYSRDVQVVWHGKQAPRTHRPEVIYYVFLSSSQNVNLIPCSRVHSEKLMFVQLVKTFPLLWNTKTHYHIYKISQWSLS
jgi:hypothetical protein